MSVVLETQPDGNYEPSEGEIVEYGKWLGMQLPEDNCFLWIAREGLKAPLPEFWKACRSENGDLYYFNFKTGSSIWDHPMDEHFRELFRQEKENPSAKSVADGAAPKPAESRADDTPTSAKKSKKKRNSDKEKHGKRATAAEDTATTDLAAVKLHKELPSVTKSVEEEGESSNSPLQATADSPDAKPIAAGGGVSGLKAIAKLSSPPLLSPNNSKGDESQNLSPSHSAKKPALKPIVDDDDANRKKIQEEKEQARKELLESLREYKASLESEKARKIAEYDRRHESAIKEEQLRQQKVTETRINELKAEFENRKKAEVKNLQRQFESDLEREKQKLEQELKTTLEDFTRGKREQYEIQKEAQSQALREVSNAAVDTRRLSNDFLDSYSAAMTAFIESVAKSHTQFTDAAEQEKLRNEAAAELRRVVEANSQAVAAEKERHRRILDALQESHEQDMQALRKRHARELEDAETQHQQAVSQAASARKEQAAFTESLSELRHAQTQELEKLREELKVQAQTELRAVLDDVAKERRALAAAAVAVASSASGTEASSEHANTSPNAPAKGRSLSRGQPPPIDANLLQVTSDETAYSPAIDPTESQRDIKTAVTEALREVFAESPFTLTSPSMASRESPARSSRGSFALSGVSPMRPNAIPSSYQDQREVIDRERQRVMQGHAYVQAQRSSLEQRRDDLKRRKHQWKQDVLSAKREGVRSSSARGQFLNRVRLQFEDQARSLERDEAVLRDSEMWLHTKEQRLLQLEQQVEDQANSGGDAYALDTSALATGFFKPHRYSTITTSDRRASYARDPFESNTASPMIAHAIDRIERRLDEFTSLVNAQQQGTSPGSGSGRHHSLSPTYPTDGQGRRHSSRAAKPGPRESAAHIDPWTTS